MRRSIHRLSAAVAASDRAAVLYEPVAITTVAQVLPYRAMLAPTKRRALVLFVTLKPRANGVLGELQ